MWQAAASSRPPPTTAPCRTAITGTLPNWKASKQACQPRECRMAAWVSRSTSSDRSRPAQKCSPSPLTTTARVSAGRLTMAVCSCAIRVSLIALRLDGRFRRMWMTGRDCATRSRSNVASRPAAGVKSVLMSWVVVWLFHLTKRLVEDDRVFSPTQPQNRGKSLAAALAYRSFSSNNELIDPRGRSTGDMKPDELSGIDLHTRAEVSCRNPFASYGEEYDRAADK